MTESFGTPNFMAPEVIKGVYDQKCDIWSIGIILHVLLVGRAPFVGKDYGDLLRQISNYEVMSFTIPGLKDRSIGAIDVLRKLVHVDPTMRPTADLILEHNWLRSLGEFTINVSDIKKSLACFKNFRQVGILQKAVLTYIV